MSKTRLSLPIVLVLVEMATAATVYGQGIEEPRVVGDSAVKTLVAPQITAIRDQAVEWAFVLTRTNPLDLGGAYGTEIRAARADGLVRHIVASAWTADGKYSAEYYLHDGLPLFVYETFECFPASAPSDSWHNFKGFAAWERRSYFDGPSIGYAEITGDPHVRNDAHWLLTSAERIVALFESQIPGSYHPARDS